MNLPSLKLHRTTVIMSGADEKKEAALLRARLRELEATDEDRAAAERARYEAALHEERRGALLRLANLETHNPDEHEKIVDRFSAQGGDTRHEMSWGQRADAARAHIQAIDAELERVQVPFAQVG